MLKNTFIFFLLVFSGVAVHAQTYSILPYYEDFETGALGTEWLTEGPGATGLSSLGGPYEGIYHYIIDLNPSGANSINAVKLHVNLLNETDVQLAFFWKDFGDEDHVGDGIYFSDDGGTTFTKVYSFFPQSYTDNIWSLFTLDVDALAAANGLSLTSTFVIKFSQEDNFDYLSGDGMAIDAIDVYSCTGNISPTIGCFGQNQSTVTFNQIDAISSYNYVWSVAGETNALITGLSSGTYTVTMTDANNCQTIESATITESNLASVTTTAITNISGTTADGGGNVTCIGSSVVTQKGICWNTAGAPTTADNLTNNGTGLSSFVSNITGLVYSTTYYVRAYAINGSGTSYGTQVSFTTTSGAPIYCSSVGGGTMRAVDDFIVLGEAGVNINNLGSSCSSYSDFTSMSADLIQGSSYSVDYTIITCGGPPGASSIVYVDWNQDGDFIDAGEIIASDDSGLGSFSFPFTVPINAAGGRTGIRIITNRSIPSGSLTPCENGHDGETEDYVLNILPSYCPVSGSNSANGYMANVNLNSLARSSTYDGYILAAQTTTLQSEETYTLSIEQQNNFSSGGWTAAWIDWNDDGDFIDAGEEIATPSKDITIGLFTRNINVT
ncbi:MAG: hypothetical protein JKY42_11225, partial [Flavobacteriales bacterium]|nr:hypothetical protein [Flavobacteriales bacterium]